MTKKGFIRLELGALLCWLGIHAVTGEAIGARWGMPRIGMGAAVLVALIPSWYLAFGAHYSAALSLLPLILLPILVSLTAEWRMWTGILFCLLPWAWVGLEWIYEEIRDSDE